MPYNTSGIIRDTYGVAVPQYFDSNLDSYQPALGSGGAIFIAQLNGNATPFTDTTTALGVSATYTGTTRDLGASYNLYNRLRVTVAHTAGTVLGHLVVEVSTDNTTWRETSRIPIPSDGQYRTFDLPINQRYARIKFINGATAQTSFFLTTLLVRSDGAIDLNKNITFNHTTTALVSGGTFNGAAMNIGTNHSFSRHRAVGFADQAGALYLQQSRDGSIWRTTQTASVAANTPVIIEDLIVHQYLRVQYINNVTAQTSFELYSALICQ